MTRTTSLLVVIAVWAAIYFPALGSLAIKGEEGRRILPGITMLQTGNYLVPQVGGETYFRKPPLINWLVAASFKITRHQNEWTARLPSVLSVLLVAIAFVTVARPSLGQRGSIIAALIWLINAGIIEKGRLVEIEALYVSLCALSIIFWLSWWLQKKSQWLIWTVPFIFLGLGWLAKGPLHLVFFYGVVVAVIWKERNWRALFHPAHLLGIIIMLGIFFAWAIPFLHATNQVTATTKWSQQFTGRLRGTDFQFSRWILNVPHGLFYLLPWVFFLPLIRFQNFESENQQRLARALAWGAIVPLVIVDLVPGSIPRYAMPALVPAIWLLGMTFSLQDVSWPRWIGLWIGGWVGGGIAVAIIQYALEHRQKYDIYLAVAIAVVVAIVLGFGVAIWCRRKLAERAYGFEARRRTIIVIVIIACVAMWTYALAVVPRMHQRQRIKRLAAQIESMIPSGETVYALDPNYQPIFFYMRAKLVYAGDIDEVPMEARYLLVRPEREQEVLESNHWAPRQPRRIMRSTDYRKESILLLKIE
ncbi:MAG TPA: glycosyltransferase family 39 protein [Chthoniobacterales bacterium]|nr:glycosyltransferase family 39 protein [Chthoniobacterales bacterium]